MAKKRLVPLMPILVRLNACGGARRWVADANYATFREAWDACPRGEWLDFLVEHLRVDLGSRWGKWRRTYGAAAIRKIVTCAEVERALYDYAVREGLA